MNFKIFGYAKPKFLRRVLFWTTLHQISIAMGTALLAFAARQITNPANLIYVLLGFALIVQLPNLIEITLRSAEQTGYLDIYRSYLDQRLLRQSGRTEAWAARAERDVYLASIGPDAAHQLIMLASNLVDTFSFLLNIGLTTLVLSVLVDGNFSWVFGISMLLSYLTYGLFKNNLQTIVRDEQQTHSKFFSYVAQGWDNVLLNNTSVHQRYGRNLESLYVRARAASSRQVSVSTFSIFAIALAASVPIFGLDIYLA